jgi:hypothetical protein
MKELLNPKHPLHNNLNKSKYKKIIITYIKQHHKLTLAYIIAGIKLRYKHDGYEPFENIWNEQKTLSSDYNSKLSPFEQPIIEAMKAEILKSNVKSKYVDAPCININFDNVNEMTLFNDQIILLDDSVMEKKDNCIEYLNTYSHEFRSIEDLIETLLKLN